MADKKGKRQKRFHHEDKKDMKYRKNKLQFEEDFDIIVELKGLVASCYAAKRYFAE